VKSIKLQEKKYIYNLFNPRDTYSSFSN